MIKILKASALHNEYLQWYYTQNSQLAASNFSHQYDEVMYDSSADTWKYYLEKTGRYQVEEHVINCYALQSAWAKEHQVLYTDDKWMLDILTEQIRLFQPDVLFAQYYDVLTSEYINMIRQEVPSIKVVVGWDGIAMHDKEKFRAFDVMLTCLYETERFYATNGKIASYMPYGFDERWLDRIRIEQDSIPISFLGSIARIKGGHFARLQLLDSLLRNVDIQLWLTTHDPSWKNHAKLLVKMLMKKDWSGIQQTVSEIRRFNRVVAHARNGLFGIAMMSKLASSSLTINSHIDVAKNNAANIRLFEATGVGACMITDYKDNLSSFFRIGQDVVSYKSHEECVEQIRYLLAHPPERTIIARSGQQATLTRHSMGKRLDIFDAVISKIL
jgi:spore maturation protein CgeB